MASARTGIIHTFDGGWATDLGESSDVVVGQDQKARIPFLVNADNVYYEFDGGPHKIGGSSKFVPTGGTPIESGAKVTGVFDFWKQGNSASGAQKRICHANTVLYDLDSEANIATGFTLDAVPHYNVFEDKVIVCTDGSGAADYPGTWDQTTWNLLASPIPNFSFSETHKLRVFGAGDQANESTLYYSVTEDPEDWTGAGSGAIQIDPGDGDRITAIKSFSGELWVFKGPVKGSIHRLQGSAPTGTDPFRLVPFVTGIGAVNMNTVFRFGNDIGFMWSDGSVHSLRSVNSFGDFRSRSLSRLINTWLYDHIVHNRLKYAWAVDDVRNGRVLISATIDSGTTNNVVLMLDYRFEEPRWAKWEAIAAASLAPMVDSASANQPIILAGSNDGFTRRIQQTSKNIDTSTVINATVKTPFMSYGSPFEYKKLGGLSVNVKPAGGAIITAGWGRDDNAETTVTFNETGSGRLATATPTSDNFVLGTSKLGSVHAKELFNDTIDGGEFRRIQYRVTNAELDRDLELHSIGALVGTGSRSLEN